MGLFQQIYHKWRYILVIIGEDRWLQEALKKWNFSGMITTIRCGSLKLIPGRSATRRSATTNVQLPRLSYQGLSATKTFSYHKFRFFLYCTARQHLAQNASTQAGIPLKYYSSFLEIKLVNFLSLPQSNSKAKVYRGWWLRFTQ